MEEETKNVLVSLLADAADYIEYGYSSSKTKIGVTVYGSEHGVDEIIRGVQLALSRDADLKVILIGSSGTDNLDGVPAKHDVEAHAVMEKMLDAGELDAAVTMHYSFPLGTATIGRVVTPAKGKEMFITTTTGTADTDRVKALIKNAIYGIATAKACGRKDPTVGILNLDGASQAEKSLQQLQRGGYPFTFAQSDRADGGTLMRGNDLLQGIADVMVTDSLTGNVLMKMLSAFNTGGSYEALGYGYGPGLSQDVEKIICIVSRASGAPVIAGAIEYAARSVRGNLLALVKEEFAAASKAGLQDILSAIKVNTRQETEEIVPPPLKAVTGEIIGIDILEIESAVASLWQEKLYAESGMGCSGPVIKVAEEDIEAAVAILQSNSFI
ncbi:MAG: glycine/sarcosine/betaine reductase complex component C subunit alpha [Firmicutes bacterium]|nr:glycine/sarcosine/betaine reductase complex component C subunit alpha [Bacillota bacterium]